MILLSRHKPPEDSEALDQRELDALMEENYSVWRHRRMEPVIGRAEYAEAIRNGIRSPAPTFEDVWPNMKMGHSGYVRVDHTPERI